MDEAALSTSILQFVGGQGQGLPGSVPPPETACIVSMPTNGVVDAPGGGRVGQSSSSEGITGSASGGARGGTAGAESTMASSQQQQGLMRSLMGNKLGNFNMRGVEAGIAMCDVTKKKSGKLLNTQDRRQKRREQSGPYGNDWSLRGKKNNAAENKGFKGGKEGPRVAGDTSPPCSTGLHQGESLDRSFESN